MLRDIIKKYIDTFEERAACEDDGNKLVVPAEIAGQLAYEDASADCGISELSMLSIEAAHIAEQFYYADQSEAISKSVYEQGILRFSSAIRTPEENNNIVQARIFERKQAKKAIVLVPHWNSPPTALFALARILVLFGYTVAVLVLPYHHSRKRDQSKIADYFVSANIGMTIRSVRQAVLDVRGIVDWLETRGCTEFHLIGASLGSCVAGITAAVDSRVVSSQLYLTAGSFGDVVWTGRATRHIASSVSHIMSIKELRAAWSVISLNSYIQLYAQRRHHILLLSGARDKVVLPAHAAAFSELLRSCGANVKHIWFPCGHYSLASFPFGAFVVYQALAFLKQIPDH